MSHDSDVLFTQQLRRLPKVKTDIPANWCSRPWKFLNIDFQGRVFLCACDGWLPFPVGHVLDFNSLDEIFNSTVAKSIQQTIIDGTYKFCDTEYCGVKFKNFAAADMYFDHDMSEPGRYHIEIGIDNSCNLYCPSCRSGLIFNDSDDYVDERISWVDRIYQWINGAPDSLFTVNVGANGEVFASSVYLRLFEKEFNSKVEYSIRTNATLAKRHIANLKLLPNLKNIQISIDAASKTIYEKVRQPAKWETLIDNLDYLVELSKIHGFKMQGSFVIQRTNIDDCSPFIKFCKDRNMGAFLVPVADWHSFKNYDNECVHRPGDELYPKFIQTINDPDTQDTWDSFLWTKDYIV